MTVSYRRIAFNPGHPLDLADTLWPLRRGGIDDPSVRIGDNEVWRATRTSQGLVTTHITAAGDGVDVEAWGPGADWAVEHAPILVGGLDDDRDFVPRHALVAELHRRHRGLRITKTEAVFEAVVPTVIEQKVPGLEARLAYRQTVRELGEPAPGPGGLTVPPSPKTLASTPYWVFHRFGVERRRAETIRRAAFYAHRLEEILFMDRSEAYRRLMALPGLGAWSAAEVALVALGDADAVSVGDYHLPHVVSWALAGQPRGDDRLMLELLEPYRGHRGRVLRLLLTGGPSPPRFGPRLPLYRIASR